MTWGLLPRRGLSQWGCLRLSLLGACGCTLSHGALLLLLGCQVDQPLLWIRVKRNTFRPGSLQVREIKQENSDLLWWLLVLQLSSPIFPWQFTSAINIYFQWFRGGNTNKLCAYPQTPWQHLPGGPSPADPPPWCPAGAWVQDPGAAAVSSPVPSLSSLGLTGLLSRRNHKVNPPGRLKAAVNVNDFYSVKASTEHTNIAYLATSKRGKVISSSNKYNVLAY